MEEETKVEVAASLDAETASVILRFLDRVELKGPEAETFFACQQRLKALLPKE